MRKSGSWFATSLVLLAASCGSSPHGAPAGTVSPPDETADAAATSPAADAHVSAADQAGGAEPGQDGSSLAPDAPVGPLPPQTDGPPAPLPPPSSSDEPLPPCKPPVRAPRGAELAG